MTDPLFDSSPSGYFSFYDDGNIHIVNQTLCDQLGFKKTEIEGHTVENIFTIPTRIFFQTHFFPMLRMQGKAEEIYMTLLSKTGVHIPVLVNAKRMNRQGRDLTVCSYIIVHNRKKFEEELIEARKAAEKALRENSELLEARTRLQEHAEELDRQLHIINERNHELNQLNHVITHNLKEPLRKIMLHVDRLQLYPLPEDTVNALEKLMRASRQMKNIVTGLQEYVWLTDSDLEFTEINLGSIIEAVQARITNELGEDLIETIFGHLPSIEADERQITLLVYHILMNAVKFRSGQKAMVSIQGTIIKKNRFVNVKGKYSYEDFLKLEIMDEGIGFDSSQYRAAFELFRKYHMSEGAGLGLALCKKIAGNHSGYISIDSQPGKGTKLELLLPVLQKGLMKEYVYGKEDHNF